MTTLLREAWSRVRKWAAGWLKGGPHFVVGDPARPYLRRWYVLPRNPLCNVYLHQFMRSDDDRALHNHPWGSLSLCLTGRYVEHTPAGRFERKGGSVVFRGADHRHRIELLNDKPVWTLFITGPRVQDWGFFCPKGFVPWQEFVSPGSPGESGKGCA